MRKIGLLPLVHFLIMVAFDLALAIICAVKIGDAISPIYRGIATILLAAAFFYLFSVILFRLQQGIFPVPSGELPERSLAEHFAFVYQLHFLLIYYTLILSPAVPLPLSRAILQALGAKLGANTYSGGIILDPPFVEAGTNTIIGNGAMIVPHVIEGQRLAYYPIKLGNNVTVGARSIIMADVHVGDGAIIAMQSVVTKGSRIPSGEIWGGTPARKLEKSEDKHPLV